MATKKKTVKKKTVKKAVKKTTKKKSPVTKKVVKKSTSKNQFQRVRATKTKIRMVVKNLLMFLVLSLISYLIFLVSNNEILNSFFFILSWILGFISLAFIISLLVLILLRAMRK